MPVAKSYQQFPLSCKPYIKNGKQYVKIISKNGSPKEVRWYSDIEYEKMYPEEKVVRIRTLKEVLGFEKGYITIFKGDTYSELEWFQNSIARYHRLFGWYIVSTEEIPALPFGVEAIKLDWDKISIDDNTLKSDADVGEVLNSLRFDPSPSEYIGNIGDKLSLVLKVIKVIPVESYYGVSNLHIMEDEETQNVFVWNTSTCALELDKIYNVTGTVKAHKLYKNIKQTVLTRCKVKD